MISCEESSPQAQEKDSPSPIEGLADPFRAIFLGFAQGLKPPPPIDFTAWAEANIVFGKESPFPGPYKQDLFPYFRKVLKCLQPDHPAREVVVMGSAQGGKTVVANTFVGGCLDLDPGPVMYVHPTIENGDRWVQTKWKPFVNNSPSLRKIFPWENRSRDAANKARYKERVDQRGHLLITGANSASSLAMVSYPRQVQDDLGKWEDNEHGDPESQADKRSQAFEYAKLLKISTPGIVGKCRITAAFNRSNQQKYHVPCPHCGFKQPLEWENFKVSLDHLAEHHKAHPNEPVEYSKAHFTCVECGGVIEQHHRNQMLDATLEYDAWVPHNPASRIEGFYIWSAYSRLMSWARIAEEYFKALGDPEKEQTFINDTVGLPWEQKGEAPPWQDLYARAKPTKEDPGYPAGIIPPGALLLTLGEDCQGDRVEWLLKGWGSGLRRWTIQRGVIEGHISEARVRDQLDALLKRKWKNTFGREFTVDMVAIDANYETNDVKDWAKRHPESRVITVKGSKQYSAPPMVPVKEERRTTGKMITRQKRHWMVGVSGMKGFLYKNLEKKDPLERGYCGFANDLDDDYFKQLCSEKRMSDTDKHGHTVMWWEKLPQVRNEVLDMEIYAEAAARRIGWHTISEEDWERIRAERETPPPEQQLDLLDPARMVIPAEKTVENPKSLVDQLA
jgi:phage terminase large subunit GpA-like protein